MQTPEAKAGVRTTGEHRSVTDMIAATLSAAVLLWVLVGAGRGFIERGYAMAAAALVAAVFMQCLLNLTAGPYRTAPSARLLPGTAGALMGALMAFLAGFLDPGREIQPEEYASIARTTERQPYAVPLLTAARADGVITNGERDAFHDDLRALERDRVLKGITTKGKTDG